LKHQIANLDCPYQVGDTLVVTFKEGTAPIEKYHLKSTNIIAGQERV
jgi:hypothetical protein